MVRMITSRDVIKVADNEFTTLASLLEICPGQWPGLFATDLGNGRHFVRDRSTTKNGEIVFVTYCQIKSCITLRVFND
jgi:hypothetical protein